MQIVNAIIGTAMLIALIFWEIQQKKENDLLKEQNIRLYEILQMVIKIKSKKKEDGNGNQDDANYRER